MPQLSELLSTHADRQGVDIWSYIVYCLYARIKLAVSNFARWFNGVLGRESPILGNFAPQKPKIRRISARRQVLPIDATRRQWRGLASIGNTCSQHVWIDGCPRRLTYLFVCLFLRLRIYPPRINLAASNFARRFIGVQVMESHILGNFASPEAPNRTNGQRAGHAHRDVNITVEVRQR